MVKYVFIFFVTAILIACSTTSQDQRSTRRHQNVILRDEILQGQGLSVFDLIRNYRPRWLRARFGSGGYPPTFYLDGIQLLYLDRIYQVMARDVLMIEYISPTDPVVPGVSSIYGAILITTFN